MVSSSLLSKNSTWFKSSLTCKDADKLKCLTDILKAEITRVASIKRWHPRYTQHLELIILNLMNCHNIDPEMVVGYSRANNRFSTLRRYDSIKLLRDSMVLIVDTMEELGYIEAELGCQVTGIASRMRITSKLLDLSNRVHGPGKMVICRNAGVETIIMKDENKKLIGYVDNSVTIRMRQNVAVINKNISENFIGLYVSDDDLVEIATKMEEKGKDSVGESQKHLDFSRVQLCRIFNNDSFEQGGRFYRGWWQEIPSDYRRNIRINDKETCEVDFSGIHINLLYVLKSLPLPDKDVYALDGLEGLPRKMLKVMLQILLNSSTERKARSGIDKEFPRSKFAKEFCNGKITTPKIISAFKEKHSPIADFFGKAYGVKLQYLDAQIAEAVLLQLSSQGIVALPVHDSFIVQREHREQLIDAMHAVTLSIYQQQFNLKVGLTDYQAAMKVYSEELLPEDLPLSKKLYKKLTDKDCPSYVRQRNAWHTLHASPL